MYDAREPVSMISSIGLSLVVFWVKI
uniref:Uncharacterized protein n=1 Tax=Arundo donax TaxID=35708 RepID=A0A0A9EMH0_ARUDO